MCDEPVQTYVRTEGEWRHFQEYLILQHAQPRARGSRVPRRRAGTVTPEIQARDRVGGGDRDRPIEPDREHRPDPRRARHARGARRRRRARSWRSARSSAEGRSRDRPRSSWNGPGLRVDDGSIASVYHGTDRRDWWPTGGRPRARLDRRGPAVPDRPDDVGRTSKAEGRGGDARIRERPCALRGRPISASHRVAAQCAPQRSCPVKQFGAAKQRLGEALGAATRAALAAAMFDDVLGPSSKRRPST